MLKQDGKLKDIQTSLGKFLLLIPLSPNQWTLLSLLVAIGAGFVIAIHHDLGLGLFLFAIAALMDAIDGAVARARNEASDLGGFLDGVIDRFVEAIFLFSLMFYPLPLFLIDPKIWLAGVLFFGTAMPSFIRAYADHKAIISHEKALELGGICERAERMAILVLSLITGIIYSMDFFVYGLVLVVILSLITIVQRLNSIILLSSLGGKQKR